MEYEGEFKFLSLQVLKRKDSEKLKEEDRQYLKLNLLDNKFNPCSFFIFDKDIIEKVLSSDYVGLQLLTVKFAIVYSNNNWNVRLVDLNE